MINLRILREKNKLTQTQVCQKMKEYGYYISRSTYSKYETENREMPYEFLIFFARFYNTTTDYILGISESIEKH